jgi:hypothetical protein
LMLHTRALLCSVALLWCAGSVGPLTPDPSPPFHGGEGRMSVRFCERRIWSLCGLGFGARVCLAGSLALREAAKEAAKGSC